MADPVYDVRTKAYLPVLEQEIKSLEYQKSVSDSFGGWPQDMEDKLQKLNQQVDDIKTGKDPMIIGEEGGWKEDFKEKIMNFLKSFNIEAGASTLYPEGGLGNYLPGQSIYPAGMSNAAWSQQNQPISNFQPPLATQAPNVFQGGPPSVSSAQSQAQLIAQEAARKAAAAEAARIAAIDATPTHSPHRGDQGGTSEAQAERERAARSGANANRGFTRTKYGKAYQRGGVVSLMDLLNRRI